MKIFLNPALYRHLSKTHVARCRDCKRQISSSNSIQLQSLKQRTPQITKPWFSHHVSQLHSQRFHCISYTRMCTVADDKVKPKINLSQLKQKRPLVTSNIALNKSDQANPQSQGNASGASNSDADDMTSPTGGKKKPKKVLKITPRMRKPNPSDYSYTGTKLLKVVIR